MDKDAEIARLKALCKQYKAAAEKWEGDYKNIEKRSSNLGDALCTEHTDCSAFCAFELAVQTQRSTCAHPGGYTNRNRRFHR
jgi:hypothetical protein